MIKIFNKRLDKAIDIDETLPDIGFEPKHYEVGNPHVRIKLPGFHFSHHAETCPECGAFRKAFGSVTTDWFITYLGKTFRLDLRRFSVNYNDNLLSHKNSIDFYGSELKLNLDLSTIEDLQKQLTKALDSEDYETCSLIRDKMDGLK
jgi:protein-arginine kinase activator protein McsA